MLQNGNSKSLISKEKKKLIIVARAVQQSQINPKYNKNTIKPKNKTKQKNNIKPIYLGTA